MVLGKLYIHKQKDEVAAYFTRYPKINLKWIIDLNVRVKTIKLLEENVGANLHDFGLVNGF